MQLSQLNPSALWSIPIKKFIYPILWLTLLITYYKFAIQPTWNTSSTSTSTTNTPKKESLTQPPPYSPLGHDILNINLEQETDSLNKLLTVNVSSSSKVAVLIETRKNHSLIPLILHFHSVLGPTWPILIYTLPDLFPLFTSSSSMRRLIHTGHITIRSLPLGLYFTNWDSVSSFLTDRWFWDDLEPADNVLLFQGDSILCSNSRRSVEEFFEWSFVGAPIAERFGVGYNGGLSLRKRRDVLRVLEEWEWTSWAEDQWFYKKMKELEERDIEEGNNDTMIRLPSMEIARTFAVETIDYPNPLGFHQATRHIREKGRMVLLDEWCPEWKLASGKRMNPVREGSW